jgi:outer membrane murein-binding lipoprotein Lpp
MEPQSPSAVTPAQPLPKQSRNPNLKGKMIMLLMAVVFLLAGAIAGYMYRDGQAKKDLDAQKAKVSTLEAKNTKLESDLVAASKEASTSTAGVRPNQATLDSISAAITSGNTAALQGYMASSVNVIRAATDGPTNGARTPAQAVGDVDYVKNGTAPWNFALPAATLATYQSGGYKQYFPTTAYVGKSANNYLISFQFDSSAKINGIFMSVDASLL